MRLLLYLDTSRSFGTILVVLKVMMREPLIVFALLFTICVGFLQPFIGLNHVGNERQNPHFIVQAMVTSVMQSSDFSGFEHLHTRWLGTVLLLPFYCYGDSSQHLECSLQ